MKSALVDTNVLLLLVVGAASDAYISRHPRTKTDFTRPDYSTLVQILSKFSIVETLPHVLAEVNSLLRQKINGDMLEDIMASLRKFIEKSVEVQLTSRAATVSSIFVRLGLTDAALLEVVLAADRTLVTMDGDLVRAANSLGKNPIDFRASLQKR